MRGWLDQYCDRAGKLNDAPQEQSQTAKNDCKIYNRTKIQPSYSDSNMAVGLFLDAVVRREQNESVGESEQGCLKKRKLR